MGDALAVLEDVETRREYDKLLAGRRRDKRTRRREAKKMEEMEEMEERRRRMKETLERMERLHCDGKGRREESE